jgi:alanine racemase
VPRPLRAEISASALTHNLEVARQHAGAARVWAVVKANAYGHGLLRAAKALEAADGFAVLDFVEALKLRKVSSRPRTWRLSRATSSRR